MPISKVQEIVDELIKSDALDTFIEESSIRVEKNNEWGRNFTGLL